MGCDICGRNADLFRAIIEGSKLNVCEGCGKFGKILGRAGSNLRPVEKKKTVERREEAVEAIVSDYNIKIKNAREKRKMTQEELAKAIAEKESVIHKIESRAIEPDLNIARKLERFFKMNLIVKGDLDIDDKQRKQEARSDVLTIGDLLSK